MMTLLLIEKARNAENGEKFQQLWEGKWESYPSESEADIALCWSSSPSGRDAIWSAWIRCFASSRTVPSEMG